MIKSFGDSETEKIWNGQKSKKIPPDIHKRAFAKLLIIHSAESEDDLKIPPGNKFEHLVGNLKDYSSIEIFLISESSGSFLAMLKSFGSIETLFSCWAYIRLSIVE